MRKITAILLMACLLLMTACSNASNNKPKTQILKKTLLPIEGCFTVKGDILIETDKPVDNNRAAKNARAFTYKDGEFYELERYETELTIPKKYSVYGEVYGKDKTIPLQYFICNSTVYAFWNTDRSKQSISNFKVFSIPGNDECVIIQEYFYIPPIYVNLKTGQMKPLVDKDKKDSPLSADVICISDDGKYAGLIGTKNGEKFSKSWLVELENFKITELYPAINSTLDDFVSSLAFFSGDNLYFYCTYSIKETAEDKSVWFLYDIKKKRTEQSKYAIDDYVGLGDSLYNHMKFDSKTGTISIMNFKTSTEHSFALFPSHGWSVSVNETGRYLVGMFYDTSPAGYDSDGVPYYEDGAFSEPKYTAIDMEAQKRLNLKKIDSKFDYTTYDGVPCRYEWLSENELAVFCIDGDKDYIQAVISLEAAQ